MRTGLAIDLYCGLGGWTEALLAEGWRVVGFDIERHDYGSGGYPGQLVLQDVRTIHGSQFRDADLIVASPPCQEFSYRAMPWKRAKALPPPVAGINLFWQCWRIQHEASEAAGRHIPMVVENVKGAQPWVGSARWHYGSFYLWGDLPALMPRVVAGFKVPGISWSGSDLPGYVSRGMNVEAAKRLSESRRRTDVEALYADRDTKGSKNGGGSWFAVAHNTTSGHSQNPDGRKVPGLNWSGSDKPGYVARAFNDTAAARFGWRDSVMDKGTSKGAARKAASAQIAKIPKPLAEHIARIFKPDDSQ